MIFEEVSPMKKLLALILVLLMLCAGHAANFAIKGRCSINGMGTGCPVPGMGSQPIGTSTDTFLFR